MTMTATTTDLPIATYCTWQNARDRASDHRIPFHPAWTDFWVFLEDNGPCPEGGRFICDSDVEGYIPGNAHWSEGRFKRSYDDCAIVIRFLNAGVLSEANAIRLACIDADIDTVQNAVLLLDAETLLQSAVERRKAFAELVDTLEQTYALVPFGEPTRWQIKAAAKHIFDENMERDRKRNPAQVEEGDFEGDPRYMPIIPPRFSLVGRR